ncbi:hypothetical protein [Ideonella livida]|uniref:Uncharacterized protein n=1 Tax=Ideonella livida TaxID=2707176 RepID=A0A7C9TK10_9BURK|nr:hypothetical protein [Ideonella livida]NDY91323.1 hypothetical protein [Ideonella livida]
MIFPELVFVVEPEQLPVAAKSPFNINAETYKPNFVIQASAEAPDKISGSLSSQSAVLKEVAKSLLKSSLVPWPVGLAVAGYEAYSAINDNRKNTQTEVPSTAPEEEKIEEQLLIFLCRYAVTVENLARSNARFQPGHPRVGQTYRLHPLANLLARGDKGPLYIPDNSFDEILLEEREAELLRLLVSLGARKITVSERLTQNSDITTTVQAEVSNGKLGEAGMDFRSQGKGRNGEFKSRVFELEGRPLKYGQRIQREKFAWLEFEPSWSSLVFAREEGGCLRATIELKQETDYSNERQIAARLKAAAYVQASTKAAKARREMEDRSHFFDVEFCPMQSES